MEVPVAKWSRLAGAANRLCFWGLVAAILAAGGFGLLPPVDAAFLILGVVLFGVACVFRQAASATTGAGARGPSPPHAPTTPPGSPEAAGRQEPARTFPATPGRNSSSR